MTKHKIFKMPKGLYFAFAQPKDIQILLLTAYHMASIFLCKYIFFSEKKAKFSNGRRFQGKKTKRSSPSHVVSCCSELNSVYQQNHKSRTTYTAFDCRKSETNLPKRGVFLKSMINRRKCLHVLQPKL